ncbi:MAG: 16S rRNA (guanine(966)-N(2))-methyltransferase RsmD [Lachnospiraceae bacterium]|nr:16S rRNA (guanine(966)-N(2))-methyltransferase RsmD [Lachnospiraceae bacterium]MEE3460882.1 16S rRNA (guanine(966)-N(2))-methyltransferase RsmD [Lachnospiraceae bacterium]
MRVIAGSARRLKLTAPEGMDTRPTQDKIKETLFNIIQADIPDASFLDIFAGSGAIAIEALSRGAREAYLIENSHEALKCIEKNLKTTGFSDKAAVIARDAVRSLPLIAMSHKAFDIIFMDPPYRKGMAENVLAGLRNTGLAGPDSLIIIEEGKDASFDYAEALGYSLVRVKEYKNNKHVFLKLKGEDA